MMIQLHQMRLILRLSHVISVEVDNLMAQSKTKTTFKRNRLKTSTLDNLLRISIEGPELEDFDFDTAVNSWSAIRKQRIATH